MEYYGRSGELLRRQQTIINLHAELNQWRAKMEAHPGNSDAANVFLARARARLEEDAALGTPLPAAWEMYLDQGLEQHVSRSALDTCTTTYAAHLHTSIH